MLEHIVNCLKSQVEKSAYHHLEKIISDEQVVKIHNDKQQIFESLIADGIKPRPGCLVTLKRCKELGIKVGFITTTTPKTINIIKEGLSNFFNFEDLSSFTFT